MPRVNGCCPFKRIGIPRIFCCNLSSFKNRIEEIEQKQQQESDKKEDTLPVQSPSEETTTQHHFKQQNEIYKAYYTSNEENEDDLYSLESSYTADLTSNYDSNKALSQKQYTIQVYKEIYPILIGLENAILNKYTDKSALGDWNQVEIVFVKLMNAAISASQSKDAKLQ